MAKKSAASLSIVPPGVATLLSAPKSLTARQKELWEEIVLSKPASWFDWSTAPLLSGYVKAIASHEFLASQSDAIEATLDDGGDLKTLNRIHAMIERQARLIQTFATKLRLIQQSRYTLVLLLSWLARHQELGHGTRVTDTRGSTTEKVNGKTRLD